MEFKEVIFYIVVPIFCTILGFMGGYKVCNNKNMKQINKKSNNNFQIGSIEYLKNKEKDNV